MKKCPICSRPGAGIRFGVLCCKGCKEFYRRSTEQTRKFQCYFGGNCSTEYDNVEQRPCRACRVRKCIELGMHSPALNRLKSLPTNVLKEPPSKNTYAEPMSAESDDSDRSSDVPSSRSSPAQDTCDERMVPFGKSNDMVQLRGYSNQNENPGNWTVLLDELEDLFDDSTDSKTFPPVVNSTFRFLPARDYRMTDFSRAVCECQRNTPEHRYLLAGTVHAVKDAAQSVFGEEIAVWTQFKNSFIWKYGDQAVEEQDKSDAMLEIVLTAVNQHNRDHNLRVLQFARQLPGMDECGYAARYFYPAGWKCIVCWTIYHAPFASDAEIYFPVGAQNLHYTRYWNERLVEPAIYTFAKKFSAELRRTQLTQVENALLMAVVMFEPVEGGPSNGFANAIHRHYVDALVFCIKERCTDSTEFLEICRKLENIFGWVRLAGVVYSRHFSTAPNWPAPFRALQNCVTIITVSADANETILVWNDQSA